MYRAVWQLAPNRWNPTGWACRRTIAMLPVCTTGIHQIGASLIEVLIAMLVMSFGLAAVAQLMAATVQYSKTAQYQMVAQQSAAQLAESMRANTDGFMANAYIRTEPYASNRAPAAVPACLLPQSCSSSEIANIDKAELANMLRQSLPGGDFNAQRNGNLADIWIMWLEPTSAASLSAGGANCRTPSMGEIGEQPRCFYLQAAL